MAAPGAYLGIFVNGLATGRTWLGGGEIFSFALNIGIVRVLEIFLHRFDCRFPGGDLKLAMAEIANMSQLKISRFCSGFCWNRTRKYLEGSN